MLSIWRWPKWRMLPPGRFIDAPGFHPHVTVLDEVHPADTVPAAEFVQRFHHPERAQLPAIHRDAIALFEIQRHILRFVRRVLRRDAQLEHRLVRGRERIHPGIFQYPRLIRDVEEVPVHRVRLLRARFDGDFLFRAILDHLGAARKLLPEGRVAPGRDHLQFGREGGGGEFESDLVIALAGGAVGDVLRLFLSRDLDHPLRDQWPRDARAEEILVLVNRPCLDHRIDEVPRELLFEIIHVEF